MYSIAVQLFKIIYLCGLLCDSAFAEIKIGATLPLSGPLAHVGTDIQRGMIMAAEELAAANNQAKIKLVFEDDRLELASSVRAAQKLLNIEKVDIIVSLWNSADVVAPLADTKQIPHIAIRWNPAVAEKHKYTFTIESTYKSYVKSQIDLLQALGAKRISLLTEEGLGWILSANEQRSAANVSGITVLRDEHFLSGEKDYKAIVTKVLADAPDVVVINAFQPNLDLLLRRIKEARPTQKITGYFEAVEPPSVEPPSLVEGLPFVAQFKVAEWFSASFKSHYKESFKVRAPHGYDIVKLVGTLYVEDEQKIASEVFMAKLSALNGYQGASGILTTNATKNIETECNWQIVRGGKFVAFTKIG